MPIKHEAKPSALLALRQCAKCFILCIARARPCFNCFKELTHERLVKAYPFQSINRPPMSSRVRRFWTIFYANASVNMLILAKLTGIHHLVSLFTIRFSYLTMLYCNIALQTYFWCYMANIAPIFALILPRKVLYIYIYIYIYIYTSI